MSGRNPAFDALLQKMQEVHDRKSQDYASDSNVYSNFEFAGSVAAGFSNPVDIAFATLIGVKIARLKELKGKGKSPQNESIEDTQLDLAVYCTLWGAYDAYQRSRWPGTDVVDREVLQAQTEDEHPAGYIITLPATMDEGTLYDWKDKTVEKRH